MPTALADSPCFLNRLTQEWCYDFGLPVDRLPNDQIAVGSTMFPSIGRLLAVVLFAFRRLTRENLDRYLCRLTDESRHQDVIAEILVVLGVPSDVSLDFEVLAETGNARTIDWRLRRGSDSPVLFDVKNRLGDAAAFLSNLVTAGANSAAVQPTHDHALLFQGVLSKFAPHSPADCLQGVWVITKVRQEETELNAAFENLDATRLHFAVVSNMSRECVALSRGDVDRNLLVRTLNLTERPGMIVCRRGP